MKTRVKKRFTDFKQHVKNIVHHHKDEPTIVPKKSEPAINYNNFANNHFDIEQSIDKPKPQTTVINKPKPVDKPMHGIIRDTTKLSRPILENTKPTIKKPISAKASPSHNFDEEINIAIIGDLNDFAEEELQLAMALSLSMMTAPVNQNLTAAESAHFRQLHDEIELNKMQKQMKTHQEAAHTNEQKIENAHYAGEPPEKYMDLITSRLMDIPVRLVSNNKPSQNVIDKTTADKILQEANPRDPYTQLPVSHYVEDHQLKNEIVSWVNQVTGMAGSAQQNQKNTTSPLRQFGMYGNSGSAGHDESEIDSLLYYQYKY